MEANIFKQNEKFYLTKKIKMFKKITGLEHKHPIRLTEMTMGLAKGIHLIVAIYAVECCGGGG